MEIGGIDRVSVKGLLTIANAWLRVEKEADDFASAFVGVSSLAFCSSRSWPQVDRSHRTDRTGLNFVVWCLFLVVICFRLEFPTGTDMLFRYLLSQRRSASLCGTA